MEHTTKRARGRQSPPFEDKMERGTKAKVKPHYEVVKSYAGVEIGTIIKSNSPSNAKLMTNKGYWKEI